MNPDSENIFANRNEVQEFIRAISHPMSTLDWMLALVHNTHLRLQLQNFIFLKNAEYVCFIKMLDMLYDYLAYEKYLADTDFIMEQISATLLIKQRIQTLMNKKISLDSLKLPVSHDRQLIKNIVNSLDMLIKLDKKNYA